MAVRWSSTMEVGIEIMDEQHKMLVEKINALLTACENGQAVSEVSSIIVFLQHYVVEHFGTEERFMIATKYPDYESHLQKHKDFLTVFVNLKKEFETDGLTAKFTNQITSVVVSWLLEHIAETDTLLGAYLEDFDLEELQVLST